MKRYIVFASEVRTFGSFVWSTWNDHFQGEFDSLKTATDYLDGCMISGGFNSGHVIDTESRTIVYEI